MSLSPLFAEQTFAYEITYFTKHFKMTSYQIKPAKKGPLWHIGKGACLITSGHRFDPGLLQSFG